MLEVIAVVKQKRWILCYVSKQWLKILILEIEPKTTLKHLIGQNFKFYLNPTN